MSTNTQTNNCPSCPTCSNWSISSIITVIILGIIIIGLCIALWRVGKTCGMVTGEAFANLKNFGNIPIKLG